MVDVEFDDVPAADGELEDAPRRSRLRLENEATIKRHLVGIFDDVSCGRISSLEGNRRARLLREIAASNRQLDHDRRLEKLEALVEAQRRSRR